MDKLAKTIYQKYSWENYSKKNFKYIKRIIKFLLIHLEYFLSTSSRFLEVFSQE